MRGVVSQSKWLFTMFVGAGTMAEMRHNPTWGMIVNIMPYYMDLSDLLGISHHSKNSHESTSGTVVAYFPFLI